MHGCVRVIRSWMSPTGGLNKVLLRHPWSSLLVAGMVELSVWRTSLRLDEGSTPSGWWTVGSLAWMVYGSGLCVVFPRLLKRSAHEIFELTWITAISVLFLPAVMELDGLVEMWTVHTAFAASLILLVIVTRTALASQAATTKARSSVAPTEGSAESAGRP